MEKYELIKQIGEGTFSTVFLARKRDSGRTCAIKILKKKYKTMMEVDELRQVKVLKRMKHPCIIELLDIFLEESILYMVFEYGCENLLESCLNTSKYLNPYLLTEYKIKEILFQVVSGIQQIHALGFVHRDIKPENILINNNNSVKIADFGLARQYRSLTMFTQYVSTRWYRAPELIIQMRRYSWHVDIFALGCLMAELYNGKPLFPGNDDQHQLSLVFQQLQHPYKNQWPEFYHWCSYNGLQIPTRKTKINQKILERDDIDPHAEKVIRSLLFINPHLRPSAAKIINHPYFDLVRYKFKTKQEQRKLQRSQSLKQKLKKGRTFSSETSKTFLIASSKKNQSINTTKEKKKIMARESYRQSTSSEPILTTINNYRKRILNRSQRKNSEKSPETLVRYQKTKATTYQYFSSSSKSRDKLSGLSSKKNFRIGGLGGKKIFDSIRGKSKTKYEFRQQNPYYV